MTERKPVTCPETGHLEQVEFERTPSGLVVVGCSRYRDADLACPRECARRMDCRERANVEDRERVLLVLANLHDDAARIGTMLAGELTADGLTVELAELEGRHVPPLADYDAVVIGAHVRLGHHDRTVIDYLARHVVDLQTLPAFFYSVGRGAYCDSHARRVTHRTGWQPTAMWTFSDASAYQRTDVRAFARLVADEIPAAIQPSMA
jgi:menaquinone-dependent protoporphyrinogen oxidase